MPIISISQSSHSGAHKLAKALQERLGYTIVDQKTASAAASRYGVSEEDLHRGLDIPANLYERLTHHKRRYILAMQATLGRLLGEGDGIYHGLAGQFLFQGLCGVFKVRLVAPLEYRLTDAMSHRHVSREEALSHLEEADSRRAKWGSQLFGSDLNDPDLYDLVLNLDHMSIESAADMIAGMVSNQEQPEDCRQQFKNFALERRIRAALFFNSPFHDDAVEVRADGGAIHLSGDKASDEVQDALVDFVSRLRGVEKVIVGGREITSVDSTLDHDIGLSSADTKARDVMLPPESYPHCKVTCTVRESIVALSASAVKLDDGHIMLPRYVLVLDDEQRMVGVVSRRELLKGLVPHLRDERESEAHIRELVPFAGGVPSDLFIRWTSLFSQGALAAASEPIGPIMAKIRGSVQVDDTLSTVISTMLHHGVDVVPVLDGHRVAGVVLMTNIFDMVAQFIIEHGGNPQGCGQEIDNG